MRTGALLFALTLGLSACVGKTIQPPGGDPAPGDLGSTVGDIMTGDPGMQGDEPGPGDALPGDALPGDPIAGDPPAGDPTSGDPVAGDPKPGDPVAGDPGPVLEVPPQSLPFLGVYFNPETYNQWGGALGNTWFARYFETGVRDQVREELAGLKDKTGTTHIKVAIHAFMHMDWPTPAADQVARLAAFANDVGEAGMYLIIGLGHPYIVKQSRLQPGVQPEAACGHLEGEVVNGWTLYWDVPDCPENHIELSQAWYRDVLLGLEAGLIDPDIIASIHVSGHVGLPFAAEMNMFRDGYPYLTDAQEYVAAMFPYLQSITSLPVSAFLLSANLNPANPTVDDNFLCNVLAAVSLADMDFIDIAFSDNVTLASINCLDTVLSTSSRKVILSDGKPAMFPGLTQAEVIQRHADRVLDNDLAGFWYWLYKDNPNNAEHIGLRQVGHVGLAPTGWKEEAVDVFQTFYDHHRASIWAEPNPCTIPGGEAGCSSTLSWVSENTGWVQVRVNDNNVFACTAEGSSSKVAEGWIDHNPKTFSVHEILNSSGCTMAATVGPSLTEVTVTGE